MIQINISINIDKILIYLSISNLYNVKDSFENLLEMLYQKLKNDLTNE